MEGSAGQGSVVSIRLQISVSISLIFRLTSSLISYTYISLSEICRVSRSVSIPIRRGLMTIGSSAEREAI